MSIESQYRRNCIMAFVSILAILVFVGCGGFTFTTASRLEQKRHSADACIQALQIQVNTLSNANFALSNLVFSLERK